VFQRREPDLGHEVAWARSGARACYAAEIGQRFLSSCARRLRGRALAIPVGATLNKSGPPVCRPSAEHVQEIVLDDGVRARARCRRLGPAEASTIGERG